METAEAHVEHPERKQMHTERAGRMKRLLNLFRKKKEDISWNLLTLRRPLRNWSRPAPA